MSTQYTNAIRWGVLALPLSGLFALGGSLLHSSVIDASRDAAGFMQSALSPNFPTGWMLVALSEIVALLGFVALYGAVKDSRGGGVALPAMALCLVGSGLFLSLVGFMAFAAPVAAKLYQQGDTKMVDVAVAGFFGGPAQSFLYPSGLIGTIGSILFGVAIWRSGTLPKWAGILFALYIPLSAFGPAISIVLDLSGGLCLLVSGAWIAVRVWQSNNTEMRATNPARA